MLHLADHLIVGRGNRRVVYGHPADPTRCLKVSLSGRSPREIRRTKSWFARWKPDRFFDDNYLEWREYQRLVRAGGAATLFLPIMHGIVETDLGPALSEELIRNTNGSVATNFRDFLHASRNNPARVAVLRPLVEQFVNWINVHLIVVRDLNLVNTVLQETPAGMRVVLIDGLGSYSMLPLEHFWRGLAVRRDRAKTDRFLGKVTTALGLPEGGFLPLPAC